MKRTLLSFALVVIASSAAAGTLEQPFDKTYDVRPGALVALGNTNGRIVVRSWDQPKVKVHAMRRAESRDSEAAQQAMNQLRIDVAPAEGGLRITTTYPKSKNDGFFEWIAGTHVDLNVTYELTVPRQMSLSIADTNGSLEVTGVSGSLKLDTTNGRITLERCAGDIDAETTNGSIHAELLAVNAGRPTRLETTNGGIHISVPRNAGFAVDAENTNGSIETDVPVATTSQRKHELRGAINGGGSQLRLRTTNGSISIGASR